MSLENQSKREEISRRLRFALDSSTQDSASLEKAFKEALNDSIGCVNEILALCSESSRSMIEMESNKYEVAFDAVVPTHVSENVCRELAELWLYISRLHSHLKDFDEAYIAAAKSLYFLKSFQGLMVYLKYSLHLKVNGSGTFIFRFTRNPPPPLSFKPPVSHYKSTLTPMQPTKLLVSNVFPEFYRYVWKNSRVVTRTANYCVNL